MPAITDRNVVFTTPWFELVAKTVDHAAGAPHYSVKTSDYVAVVALTTQGRVLLVRQYRAAVEQETLELPSGHAEPGEDPALAAARELSEETGHSVDKLEFLGGFNPDTGRLGNRLLCYFGAGARPIGPGWRREAEVEPLTHSPAELADLIRNGAFDHALHVAAVFLAVFQGKLVLPEREAE